MSSEKDQKFIREQWQQSGLHPVQIANLTGVSIRRIKDFLAEKIELSPKEIEKASWGDEMSEKVKKQPKIIDIPVEQVSPHPTNAEIYGDGADEELIQSVKEHGVLTPILVTPAPHVILSGHRRHDAAGKVGEKTIPCIIYDGSDDAGALEQILIEANRQRQKTAEQIGRELARLEAIEKAKAKERQSAGGKGEQTVGNGKAIVKAAAVIGIGEQKARRSVAVVKEIDKRQAQGDEEGAAHLRKTMNGKSVNAAWSEAKKERSTKQQASPEIAPPELVKELLREKNSAKDEIDELEDNIEELEDEIEKLNARINGLENENALLRAENEALRKNGEKGRCICCKHEECIMSEGCAKGNAHIPGMHCSEMNTCYDYRSDENDDTHANVWCKTFDKENLLHVVDDYGEHVEDWMLAPIPDEDGMWRGTFRGKKTKLYSKGAEKFQHNETVIIVPRKIADRMREGVIEEKK